MATGFYIGVDGKARKVKGAYIGIDGVARKIKKGYIGGENGVARLCFTAFDPDPVFANNSWENIALACQLGEIPDTWKVGDQKTMTIGTDDYVMDIIGKNHDTYSDGSGKAPLTFQMHGCYKETFLFNDTDSNSGGWAMSDIRVSTLPSLLEKLPTNVRNSIRKVEKLSTDGNQTTGLRNNSDTLFLLSEAEIFGTNTVSSVKEGTQYEYYKTPGRASKLFGSSHRNWWTRSAYTSSDSKVGLVYNGEIKSWLPANYAGVAFAFCF